MPIFSIAARNSLQVDTILDVLAERDRQDHKWGQPPDDRSPERWLAILAEEAGEVAEEVAEWGEAQEAGLSLKRLVQEFRVAAMREELVQVAAVAVSWIEHIDRLSLKSQ